MTEAITVKKSAVDPRKGHMRVKRTADNKSRLVVGGVLATTVITGTLVIDPTQNT